MIAVDAMGGDYAPHVAVQGAYNAAKKGISILLYGQQNIVVELLNTIDRNWQQLPLSVVHCADVIGMAEEPSKAVIKKKNSSIVRALQAVANQESRAFVSAGHSGAILIASIVCLGKIEGLLRPALGAFLPTNKGFVFCLDLGANTDCKPEFLKQFALMGHVYVQQVKNIKNPRIALLSNGQERYKGSAVVKEAYTLLETSTFNFHGNIEAKDIFNDYADVVVCDGFVGNAVLKAIEGTAGAIKDWLVNAYSHSYWTKMVGYLNRPLLRTLQKKIDYTHYGGALLLGVNAPVVIAHGSSTAEAICNAIVLAHKTAENGGVSRFNFGVRESLDQEPVIHSTEKSSTMVLEN